MGAHAASNGADPDKVGCRSGQPRCSASASHRRRRSRFRRPLPHSTFATLSPRSRT